MPYLRLPNDSYVEVPEGMSREEALAIAQERFPNLYSPQTFSQRLGRAGVRGIEALAESAKGLGLFGRAVSGDTEGAQRTIEEMRKEALEESKKPQPLSVEALKNIYASQGFGEMAGKIPAYVAEQVAQNLPSMAVPLGVGAGVAAVSGPFAPITGPLAGIGTYGLQQLGQFMQTQALTKDRTAETLEPLTAAGAAAATAPLGYFVDRFVFGLGRVGPEAAKRALVKELASRSAAGAAGRGAVRGLAEVPTELIETAAERAQAGLSLTDEEAKKQYIETAASAGVVGPSISAVSGYRERGQAKDIQEELDAAERRKQLQEQRIKDEEAERIARIPGQTPPADVEAADAKIEELTAKYEALKKKGKAKSDEGKALRKEIYETKKSISLRDYGGTQLDLFGEVGGAYTPVTARPQAPKEADLAEYLSGYAVAQRDLSRIADEVEAAKEANNIDAFTELKDLYETREKALTALGEEAKAAGVQQDQLDVVKNGYVNVLESLRRQADAEMKKSKPKLLKLKDLGNRIKAVEAAYQRSPEFGIGVMGAAKERYDASVYKNFVNKIEEYLSDSTVQKNYEDAVRFEREQNIAKLKQLDDKYTQLKNEGRAESLEGIQVNNERTALKNQIGEIEPVSEALPAQYGLEDYAGMVRDLETERKKKALAQQRAIKETRYEADKIIDRATNQAQQAPIETLLGTSGQKPSFPKLDTQIDRVREQESSLAKRLETVQTALENARQEAEKQRAALKEQGRSTEDVKTPLKYIKAVENVSASLASFRDKKAAELGVPRWYLDEKLKGVEGTALFRPTPEIPPEVAPDMAPLIGPEAKEQREKLKRPSVAPAAPETTIRSADKLREAWTSGSLTGELSNILGLDLDSTLDLNTLKDAQKALPAIDKRIAELTEKRRDLFFNLRVPTEETAENRAAMSAELANAESALTVLKDLQNKATQTIPKEAEQEFVKALEELPEEKLNKQQLRNKTSAQITRRVELLGDFISNITRLRQGKYAEVTSQETTTREEIVAKAKEQVEGILWSLKRESDFIHREFNRAPLSSAEVTARTKDLKTKLLRLIDTAVPTTSDAMARLRRQMAEAQERARSLGVSTTNEIKRIRREMQEAAGEGKPQVSEVRGVSKKEVTAIENSVNAAARSLVGIDRAKKQIGPWALTQPSAKFAQIDTSTQGILNKLNAAQRRLGREVPEFEEVKRAIEDGVTSKTLLDEARQAAEATLLGREVDLGAIQEELRALQQAPVGTEESGQRAMFDVLGVARTTPKRFENIKAREKYKYEQEQARQKADAERTEELKRLERVAAWQKQKAEEEANRIRIGGAYKVYTSETLGRVKAPDFADIEVDGKVVRHVPYKTGLETTQFVETKERGRPTQTLEYVSAVPSRGTQKPTPKAEILRSKAQQMAEEFEKDAEKRINEIYASLDKEADEWRKKADDTLASIRSYRADITKKGLSLTEGELQTKYDKLAELQKDVDFYTAQARTVKTDTFRNSIKENDVILQRINKLIDSFKETEKQLTAKAEAAKVRAFKNAVGKSLDALAKNIKDQKAALKAQPSVSVAPRVLVRKEMRVKKPLPGTELGKIQEQLNALKERIKANRKILGESTQKQISAWDATFIPRDVEGGFKNMADWLNTPEKRAAHLQKMQDIEQYLELDSRMVESYLSEVVQKTNDIKDRWAEVELKATNERTLKAKIERKLYNESTNAIKALTKGIERISKATTEINATQLKGVGKLKVKFKDIEELNKKEVNAFVKKVISQKNKDGIDKNDFTEQLEKLSKAKATLKKKLKTAEEALKRAVAAQTTSAKNLRDMGAAVDTSTLSAKDKKDLADKVKVTQEALETLGRLPEDYEVIRKTHVKTEGFYKSFRTLESPETPTTAEGKELSQAQAEAAQDQVTFRSRYKYPEEFIKQYNLNPEEAQGFREYLKDSKYDRDDAAERPATEADRGIDLKAASEVAARVQKALPKNIEFVYAETVAKAPVEFQVALYKKGGMAKGMVTPDGKVVVIGEAHASVKDLEETIAHELIGHYGVDVVLGPKRMQALVDRLFKQGEQHVADVATALGVFPDVETALMGLGYTRPQVNLTRRRLVQAMGAAFVKPSMPLKLIKAFEATKLTEDALGDAIWAGRTHFEAVIDALEAHTKTKINLDTVQDALYTAITKIADVDIARISNAYDYADAAYIESELLDYVEKHKDAPEVLQKIKRAYDVAAADIIALVKPQASKQAVKQEAKESAQSDATREQIKMAVVREMIAHAAEPRRVAPTFTQKVKAFIQDMVAAVRSWFRSLGMSDMAKRDTKEIQALIREAAKSLAAGRLGQYTAPSKTPAFRTAKGKMPAGFEAVKEAADAFIHQDAPLKQRILGTATGMSFKQTYVDSLAPTEEILMKNWDNKKAQQAMFSLQQYQDMLTLASAAAENGALQKVKNADGSYTIKSVEGPSLKSSVEALRPLLKMGFDAEGANRLATAYVGALRAEEEGYQKLNYDPEVIKLIKEVVPVVRANPEVKAVLDDFLDQWNAFNKGNLKLLLDTGKITKELYDELAKKKNYIPYYRNVDGELMLYLGDENPIRLGNMTDAQYLQPLIGGDDKILDFFSSGMKNTVLLTDLAVRNEAAQRLGVAMQDLKLGKIIPGMATGKNIVPYNIDGKPFYLRVETDGTAFEGVAPEMVIKGLNGMTLIIPDWLRMVNLPARLLRKGITLDPTYPFRNLYKDALSQGALKGVSGSNFKNLLTAFSNYMFKGKEIEELQRKGVIQSRLYTGTMEDVAAAQRRVVKGANLFSKYVAGQELRAARADGAVRLMLYEHFLKNGMGEGEALFATSKSMAYTRHGTSPGMRYLASMIPFFDAQVTALSSLHDSFNKKMPWDKKLNLKKKLWSAGMMMSLSTLVYSAMVSDEDWYKDMPEETRLRNWLIKLPWLDTPLALPIPFEFGVIFKALPEAIYGGMFTDTAEGAKMRDAMRQIILSSIPGGIIPIEQVPVFKAVPAGPMAATAFLPIIEIASNRSTYNQRPLETARDLAVLPEDRAREGTSEVSKRLAQLTGVSPILTDHAIRGYTGTLGPALVALVDTITGPAEAGPAAAEQPLNKWPILSQFFKTGDGGAIIDLVMDTVTKESRYTESYKKYLAEGKDQKAAEFMRDYESEIRRGSVADKLRERLGKYAAAERAIKNSDYTPAQKAEEIKNLRKAKNEDFRQLKESLAI